MRKYAQTKIIKIISDLYELSPDEYRDTFRSPEKDFTRKRKQALGAIVKTGILNAGSCLNSQLRQCYGMGGKADSLRIYTAKGQAYVIILQTSFR